MGHACLVRVGGLSAVPLGLVARGAALTEPRGALRSEVAIAIFDSSVPVGGAQAVYMAGTAEELTGAELERGIEVFGRLSVADVGRTWGLEDVQAPSPFRIYRATVSEHHVLIPGRDPERGTGVDRRERVELA